MFYSIHYFFSGNRLNVIWNILDKNTELVGIRLNCVDHQLDSEYYANREVAEFDIDFGIYSVYTDFDFDRNKIDSLNGLYLYNVTATPHAKHELIGFKEERPLHSDEEDLLHSVLKPGLNYPKIISTPVVDILQERTYLIDGSKLWVSRDGKPFQDISNTEAGRKALTTNTFPMFLFT